MNADEYQKYVIDLGLESPSNADILAAIAPMTRDDIKTDDVRRWLRESGLWFRSGPQSMAGTIQTAIDRGGLPDELVAALGEFYSSLFGDSALTLSTSTRPEIAARIYQGWQGIVAVGAATQDNADAFFALGGGLPFATMTTEDIELASVDYANRQASETLEQEFDAGINAHVSQAITDGDRPGVIAGLQSLLESMEA